MKRSSWAAIIIIVLIILVGGGYALFHNSNNSNTSNNSSAPTSQNNTPAGNAVFVTKTDPTLGQYLADPTGKPLYTYNADSSGVSNCTGSCLSNWPPYTVTSTAANLPSGVSTIKRTDNGETQYTYHDMPLYYFTGDSAGKVTGNNVENFSIAKPASSNSDTPSSTAPAQNNNSGYPY
jgi:predicted lipoprotein with Yx(FWY)xxD motif